MLPGRSDSQSYRDFDLLALNYFANLEDFLPPRPRTNPAILHDMAVKRSADEVDAAPLVSRRREVKRTKLSPTTQDDRDSSDPSSGSVSEDSGLQSSPPASEHTRKTSLSSIQSSISSDLSESSLDDSESATDSNSDDGDAIVTIGGPKKPDMTQANASEGAQDLRSRLDALLPQLAASNQLLASSDRAMSIENVEEGEAHIEMNLGLGVLEEQQEGLDSESEDSDESDARLLQSEDAPTSSGAVKRNIEDRETDVMDTLLGQTKVGQRTGIQDMG